MAYALPLHDSPLREMFDIQTLVALADRENILKLPSLSQARNSAMEFLKHEKIAVAVNSICIDKDGMLRLVKFGRRGGIYRLWNFGPIFGS